MKRITSLLSLPVVAIGLSLPSCTCPSQPAGPGQSIIESQSIVGLWQKTQEVTLDDGDGGSVTVSQRTNLYKCILGDGNFILFRAYSDSVTGQPTSRIEMYGTYELQGDTVCHEVITNHCVLPELTGVSSEVHYHLPDARSMSLYYNLDVPDGSAGSSEWSPEQWMRVPTK